jgi:hypothetical protein
MRTIALLLFSLSLIAGAHGRRAVGLGDKGPLIDPNGGRVTAMAGSAMDPNGNATSAQNDVGSRLDPNG